MNLLQVRTLLVNQTGRLDLVVDDVSYVDAGANAYINEAQRELDRMGRTPFSYGQYRHTVLAGETVFHLPNFRAVTAVKLRTIPTTGVSAGVDLKRRSVQYIDSLRAVGSVCVTTNPTFYAEVNDVVNGAAKYGSSQIADGTFSGDGTAWTWTGSGNLLVSGGRMRHSAGIESSIYQDSVLFSGRTYYVSVRVYRRSTSGTVSVYLGASPSIQYSQTGTFAIEAVASSAQFKIVFSSDFDGWIDDVIVKEVHNEFMTDFGDASDVQFPSNGTTASYNPAISIIIHPAPDSAKGLVLEAHGLVYSSALTLDADESYWTSQHPYLLVEAVRLLLERGRRNRAGVASSLDSLRTSLRDIDYDMTEGELSMLTSIEGHHE